jgi:hypothetical protein
VPEIALGLLVATLCRDLSAACAQASSEAGDAEAQMRVVDVDLDVPARIRFGPRGPHPQLAASLPSPREGGEPGGLGRLRITIVAANPAAPVSGPPREPHA